MTGKKIGKDNIYIHISAVNTLPPHLVERIASAIGSLAIERVNLDWDEYNFVITHPNHIEFVEAEEFDTTYEPVLGKRYRVTIDDTVSFIERPAKPRVLHQRYKTVKDNYNGFFVDDDRAREKWYRAHFDAKRMAGAGFHHKWMEMLAEIT